MKAQPIGQPRRLTEADICFSDEIIEADGKLNFYMDTAFNVDRVFGTNVETAANDDWINVYANYDITSEQACDTLDIILNRADGSCEELSYTLEAREKEILLEKMRVYCQDKEGMTLKAYCDILREESEQLTGPMTQQV